MTIIKYAINIFVVAIPVLFGVFNTKRRPSLAYLTHRPITDKLLDMTPLICALIENRLLAVS